MRCITRLNAPRSGRLLAYQPLMRTCSQMSALESEAATTCAAPRRALRLGATLTPSTEALLARVLTPTAKSWVAHVLPAPFAADAMEGWAAPVRRGKRVLRVLRARRRLTSIGGSCNVMCLDVLRGVFAKHRVGGARWWRRSAPRGCGNRILDGFSTVLIEALGRVDIGKVRHAR